MSFIHGKWPCSLDHRHPHSCGNSACNRPQCVPKGWQPEPSPTSSHRWVLVSAVSNLLPFSCPAQSYVDPSQVEPFVVCGRMSTEKLSWILPQIEMNVVKVKSELLSFLDRVRNPRSVLPKWLLWAETEVEEQLIRKQWDRTWCSGRIWNSSTWESGVGRQWVWSQPGLCIKSLSQKTNKQTDRQTNRTGQSTQSRDSPASSIALCLTHWMEWWLSSPLDWCRDF